MFLIIFLILALFIIFYFKPYHYYNIFQSGKQLKKTENQNFLEVKTKTQWWYFDCYLEDGSIMVFLFAPNQWWSEQEFRNENESLFYFSYLSKDGQILIDKAFIKIEDAEFNKSSIKTSYFELHKNYNGKNRTYNIIFHLEKVKGSIILKPNTKPFSPFPTGRINTFFSKYFTGFKGDAPHFRYTAQVPSGKVDNNLKIEGQEINIKGMGYHEQGYFRGWPNEMGQGWIWVHFVSKSIKIFGKPGIFLYIEKEGKILFNGLTLFKKCKLSDKVYSENQKDILINGTLHYQSQKISFDIIPGNKPSKILISIPSYDGKQTWASVAQPSEIKINYKGKTLSEEGNLILESCKMG